MLERFRRPFIVRRKRRYSPVTQIASLKRLCGRLAAGTNRSSKVGCRPSAPSGPPAVPQLYSAPALGLEPKILIGVQPLEHGDLKDVYEKTDISFINFNF
jgi:hypothetical protein